MRKLAAVFICCVLSINFSVQTVEIAWSATVDILPKPKQMELSGASFPFPGGTLNLDNKVQERFGSAVKTFEFNRNSDAKALPVRVELATNVKAPISNPEVQKALLRPEAYWMEIKKEGVRIVGADPEGALHGLTTLEKLFIAGGGTLKEGMILDWPDHRVRGLHLGLSGGELESERKYRHLISPDDFKGLIVKARQMKFNTIVVRISDGIRLKSMSKLVADDAWSVDTFLNVVNFARQNGLEVIPELKLLTHQEKLLKDKYPSLMYNKSTYDPRKEETYQVVLPILDELIDLIHPRALHIGHDEVAGHNDRSRRRWLNSEEPVLPASLFLQDVVRLYTHLQKRGVETWMWGDMLVSAGEFRQMKPNSLHGIGEYAGLLDKIPKEIVICDWHYSDTGNDFPSALAFARAGHRVIGVTWRRPDTIRNFSRYVAKMPTGGLGMLATTWGLYRKGEMQVLDEIIMNSGAAFWSSS